MKKILLASAALAALIAGSASANDNAFTGFNFGAQGGYTHDKFSDKDSDSGTSHDNKSAATIGLFTGYGYQFENNLYLGGELEGNIFSGKISHTDEDGDKTSIKSRYDFGANLRAGYVFDNNILGYVLIGVNTSDIDVKEIDADSAAGSFKKSTNVFGYKIGAGAEMKFLESYFARLQYDYKMTNKKKFGDVKTDLDQHNVRFGLGMII